MPRPVVSRAQEILEELETGAPKGDFSSEPIQLRLFAADDGIRQEVAGLDVLALSPIEALNKLFELQKKAKGK